MMKYLLLTVLLCCTFPAVSQAGESSWIFLPGRFSHDPQTGTRVSQYAPVPRVAALPDAMQYASGYARRRVNQYGPDGTVNSYIRVENWSNNPGRIDAQWERYNDVWQRSVLSGGYNSGFYTNDPRYFRRYRDPRAGYNYPGYGYPGYGRGGGYGGYPPYREF